MLIRSHCHQNERPSCCRYLSLSPPPEWLFLLCTFASVGRAPLAAFRPCHPPHFVSVSLLWRLLSQNAATLSSVRHVGMLGSLFTKTLGDDARGVTFQTAFGPHPITSPWTRCTSKSFYLHAFRMWCCCCCCWAPQKNEI